MLEQGYLIDFSKELIAELARRGYDPVLGARPLRRVIQDTLESNLSKLILTNKLEKGSHSLIDMSVLE
jgi:ATP-dependent Clp protease ATP-binding subunit ClpA